MSEESELFRPTEVEVAIRDDAELVRITLSDDSGKSQVAALTKAQTSLLVVKLLEKVPSATLVPIGQNSLRHGQDYQVIGHGIARRSEGLVLELFLELLPDFSVLLKSSRKTHCPA